VLEYNEGFGGVQSISDAGADALHLSARIGRAVGPAVRRKQVRLLSIGESFFAHPPHCRKRGWDAAAGLAVHYRARPNLRRRDWNAKKTVEILEKFFKAAEQ
jgi:hypothetical protein